MNNSRYLSNEKRDKAAALAALDELRSAGARDKDALERKASDVILFVLSI